VGGAREDYEKLISSRDDANVNQKIARKWNGERSGVSRPMLSTSGG
jgi:hypothetical protein